MTIAVRVSPADAALKAAQAVLTKVGGHPGNPYHDPQTGEFTTGPGGGGSAGAHLFNEGPKFPHGPSNKERRLVVELAEANRELHALNRGGTDPEDPDVKSAASRVRTLQAQVNAARANRSAELARLMQQTGAQTQRPFNSLDPNSRLAAENRARQAAHLAQQGQERRRAESLLSEIESAGGTAPAYGSSTYRVGDASYSRSTGTPGSAQGLRQALIDTSARVSRAAAAVQVIATNIHGATATSDYSRIGAHLNQVKSNINSLNSELKGLPADAKVLYREVSTSLRRAKTAVDRMARTVQSKITGSGKKKK